jgi:hypothetical protein
MAGHDVHPEVGASDVVLGEVTQEELDAEAEAADIDMQLEFEELEAEGCAIDQGSQATRAVTARDAAVAAATSRLKVELSSLRDEVNARSGGVTARTVLVNRLDFSSQAEATVTTLGIAARCPSVQAELQRALGASIEDAVWSWLYTRSQHEGDAGCTENSDADATNIALRQWTHGLAVATSSSVRSQTCLELMQELRSVAARNAARNEQLRVRIADLRRACGLKQQLAALEAESKVLLQTLASLRQKCIDQHVNRATFGQGSVSAPGQVESTEDVMKLKAEIAAADARLDLVRRQLEDAGKSFVCAVPQRETAGSGPAAVGADHAFSDAHGKELKLTEMTLSVSTGTECQIDIE